MINWGAVPTSSVLPFTFGTYGKTNGESITLTGLAVTDIEVYKGTSMTQRASDAGYVLLDTDGIDIDAITGIHGFSIDTGDNTDAGFYAAGSFYTVVVSAVTVDGQTVNFIAGTFRLVAAENTVGTPVVDAVRISGDSAAADALEAAFDGTVGPHYPLGIIDRGTLQSASGTTAVLRAGASFGDDIPIGSTLQIIAGTGVGQSRAILDYVGATDTATVSAWTVTPDATSEYQIFGSAPGEGVAQTGDAYAVVNHVTHGNSALKTLVDAAKVDTAAILVDTGTDGVVVAAASKTGYALSAAGIQAIWDALTSALTTVGSIGKFLVDRIDAVLSTRTLATADYATEATALAVKAKTDNLPAAPAATGDIPTAAAIADAVYDEATSGHTTAGTYGDKLGAHLPAILKALLTTGSTTTAVVLNATTGIDGAAPSSVNDFYNGRVIVFTSGALAGQATDVTDYVGATQTLTVTALTGAPASGVTAVIV